MMKKKPKRKKRREKEIFLIYPEDELKMDYVKMHRERKRLAKKRRVDYIV
jgi:hypothetical protein